jgi:pimeloyl-ACP methyl ester carboxylesterase
VDRPRLLLVPEFTELTWTIKPQLSEWADVVSYDPPGVGMEPLPAGDPAEMTRDVVIDRGLEKLDAAGWDRFFILADGWGNAAATRIAAARRSSVLGMAMGHAAVSLSREGERPAINWAVYDAMTQLLRQDREAFIRYGIAQSTAGSVSDELAQQMIDRFPKELLLVGWERWTAEDDEFAAILKELDVPLLFAKHEGCLMSTDEGFEDAVAELGPSRAISVPVAPSTSDEFAAAVREFCEDVSRRAERGRAGR